MREKRYNKDYKTKSVENNIVTLRMLARAGALLARASEIGRGREGEGNEDVWRGAVCGIKFASRALKGSSCGGRDGCACKRWWEDPVDAGNNE